MTGYAINVTIYKDSGLVRSIESTDDFLPEEKYEHIYELTKGENDSKGVMNMWFWWFMLICDLIIPAIMIISGRLMWKHPPKKINRVIGYRTSRAMKNMDTWIFAHEYCGSMWWKIGWILLIPSFLVHIPVYGADDNSIGIVGGILITIQTIILLVSIIPTENALKKKFTDDGVLR